jgi:hypothetical protein
MNIRKALLVLPVLALGLAASAPAQCPGGSGGTLTVTPDACVQPGDTITVDACGATGGIFSFGLLAVSTTAGSTPIGGMGLFPSAELCLGGPIAFFPLMPGTGGCSGFEFTVPVGVPLPGDVNLVLQGVFLGFDLTNFPPSISIVTTNTDSLCL